MEPIRVVEGTGTGPTGTAAYDAALAAANVHNYNLVRLSSVIPEGTTVEHVGTAPDLGAVGDALAVVRARAVGRGRVAAALAWGQTPTGTGLFYEASATADEDSDPADAAPATDDEGSAADDEAPATGDEASATAGRSTKPDGIDEDAEPDGIDEGAGGDWIDEGAGGDGAAGADPRSAALERARRGLSAGTDLRGWTLADRDHAVARADAGDTRRACAVVLAVYGTGDPLLPGDGA